MMRKLMPWLTARVDPIESANIRIEKDGVSQGGEDGVITVIKDVHYSKNILYLSPLFAFKSLIGLVPSMKTPGYRIIWTWSMIVYFMAILLVVSSVLQIIDFINSGSDIWFLLKFFVLYFTRIQSLLTFTLYLTQRKTFSRAIVLVPVATRRLGFTLADYDRVWKTALAFHITTGCLLVGIFGAMSHYFLFSRRTHFHDLGNWFFYPFFQDSSSQSLHDTLAAISFSHLLFASLLPTLSYEMVCCVIGNFFNILIEKLEARRPLTEHDLLEFFSINHQIHDLAKVSVAAYSPILLPFFVGTTLSIFFTMYSIAYVENSNRLETYAYILFYCSLLAAVVLTSDYLMNKGDNFRNWLTDVAARRDLSQPVRSQIAQIQSLIEGTEARASICGCFLLNRSVLLTVFSFIMTYFIIIVQFRSTPSVSLQQTSLNTTSSVG